MNYKRVLTITTIVVAIVCSARATTNNVLQETSKIDKKDIESYRKAAEAGDVEAMEELGWAYYKENGTAAERLEAIKWWCKAGVRLSDMTKSMLRLMYYGEEGELINTAVDVKLATGGRQLSDSCDPIAFRFEVAKREYVARKTGFWSDPTWPPFPALVAVTNATGLNLDFSRRLEDSVNGKLAQFPDGEIRWTEDGTNGLSFAETSVRMNAAHIEVAKELMRGMEKKSSNKPEDKSSATWMLNDDFTFGYLTVHYEGGRDAVYYAFTTRREINGAPAKTCVLVGFAPTQLMSDSIMRSFFGDKAAQSNLDVLKDMGIVMVAE